MLNFLSAEQFEIVKLVVQKSPKESNIDSIQWTYKELIQFIENNFSITIKERTALKYFNKMGFVRKRPKQQYARASEEKKKNS
jgi:transposase